MRGEAGRSRLILSTRARRSRAARARCGGGRAFGGGTPPDVPLAGATRAALAAAERANMSAKLALVRTDARRSSRRKNASLECLPPIAPPRASLWDHEPRTFVFSRLVSIRDYTVQGYGRIDGARLDEHRDEFRRTHGRFISPRVSSLSRGRSAPAPSFTARATSSGARCPPRASHPRRRSRRSVSVSPPRTPSRRSDRRLLGRPNRRPPGAYHHPP